MKKARAIQRKENSASLASFGYTIESDYSICDNGVYEYFP
jgi:hypothetical protein